MRSGAQGGEIPLSKIPLPFPIIDVWLLLARSIFQYYFMLFYLLSSGPK